MAADKPTQGQIVAFGNTPQAKDDNLTGLGNEDTSAIIYLNVMGNDLGGNGKSMWSVDDGISEGGERPVDLLTKDAVDAVGSSLLGAQIWITADGRVAYQSTAAMRAAWQSLPVGQTVTDSFTYAIQMGNNGALSWAKVNVVLAGTNDVPTVESVSISAVEDGPAVTGTFLGNDIDSDDDQSTLTYNITAQPATGTLTKSGTSFTYAPGSNFQELAEGQTQALSFTYTATDKHGAVSAPANGAITVTGVNDAPTLQGGSLAATEDGPAVTLGLAALGNDIDSDDDGSTLTYSVKSATPGGTASISSTTLSFAPGADFQTLALGETTAFNVNVEAKDKHGATAAADFAVKVTGVNDAPTLQAGTAAIIEDAAAVTVNLGALGGDVDSDDDGNTLSYGMLNMPAGGTAAITGTTLTVGPGASFQGLAQGETQTYNLSIQAKDQHGATATNDVAVTVTGVNDQPSLQAGTLLAAEDGPVATLQLAPLGDDIDSDDDGSTLKYGLLNLPATGAASIAGTTLSYAPGANFQGLALGETVKFDLGVEAKDKHGATATNNVAVTVVGTNDVPVVQNVNTFVFEDGAPTTAAFIGDDVDSDDDGASLKYAITSPVAPGTLTNNGNGTFTYDPGSNFQALSKGEAVFLNFNYTATDSHSAVSTPATVSIKVGGTNDAPTMNAGNMAAAEDGAPVVLSLATLADDIDNDNDGSNLFYALLGPAPAGNASIAGSTLTFNPNKDFQSLAAGQVQSFNLNVEATDLHNAKVSNTVQVSVTGVNDAPVINGGDPNGSVTQASGVAAFTVQQWTGYPGGNYSLAALKSYAGSNAPNYTVTTNVIDYTDDPGGFAGEIPGSVRWPAAQATNTDGTGAAINNTFFVRITGQLVVTTADTYTFRTYNDDGVYLHVNNQLVINDSGIHPEAPFEGSLALAPGVYPIELFFFEHGGEASLEFTYRNSTGTYTHVVAADKLGDAGVILFSDVDLTDAHTVSVAPNGATLGTLTAAVTTDTTGSGNGGQVGWNYTVDNKATTYLGAGESKTETFTVTVNDNKGGTAQQTVSVVINGVNDMPVITTTTDEAKGNTKEDTDLSVSGQIKITDPDVTDTHTWSISQPTSGVYGSASVDGSGKWTYALNNGTNGVASAVQSLSQGQTVIETFTVRASDGHGGNADQVVHVVVAGINDAAVISSQSQSLTESNAAQSANGTLTISDIDSPASFNAQSLAGLYGTLNLQANGAWTYTMNGPHNEFEQGKNYADTFSVSSVDGTTKVNAVTINIAGTNDAPTAVNDSNSLTAAPANQAATTTVQWVDWTQASAGQVKGVITLPGGQTIGVTYSGDYYNTTQINGGTFFYTTPAPLPGDLTFGTGTYTSAAVSNGPATSDIIAFNLATSRTLTFSQPVDDLFFAVVSLNRNPSGQDNGYRFDQDFDILSYGRGFFGDGGAIKTALPDGRFELRSTPNASGQTELHGMVGIKGSVTTLTWDSLSNETWNGFTVGTYGKAQTAVATGNLLANDTDPENNPLNVVSVNGQSIVGNSITLTLPSGARVTVNKNGTYDYDENGKFGALTAGQSANDTFTYVVKDSFNASSNVATATITVNGINDVPQTKADTAATQEDTAVTIDVLANDSDVDQGDTLTLQSVTNGGKGTVTIVAGKAVYTPNANVFGSDTFTYTVKDSAGLTSTASVAVTVNPVPDAPTTKADLATVQEESSVTIDVLANDSDGDPGDTLTLQSVTNGANGTVAIVSNKAVYTPNANFFGSDTFNYTVKDSTGLTGTASVAVTVNAVNDGPSIKFLPMITNGSFEQPGVSGNIFTGGSTAMTGWTVTGVDVDYIPSSTWQAANGSFSLDLNGFNNGGVKQTITTVPGQTYTIGFSLSQNNLGSTAAVRVAAGSTVKDYVFALDTTAPNDMKWAGQTFTFTATSASTDLSFTSLNSGANGPALDDVVAVATKENTSTTISGLSVFDPDAGTNPINIQLSVAHGALALSNTAGLVVLDGNGSDGTISYAGPQASINAALASGVIYSPTANYFGGDTLVATVNDAGHTGGGNLSASTNVAISVYEVTLPQPISFWLADGNANDSIAPLNNGTLNGGVSFAPGRNGGQAFSFDGTNDYVAVSRELTNDFTVFGWMKTTQVAPAGNQFFHGDGLVYADVGGVNNDFGISQVGTKIAFGTGNPDTSILSTSDVNTGNWVQFAAVRNGSVLSLWINGVQEATINTGNSGALATPPNIIFGANTIDNRYFQGQMDDIQFFDRALTPIEVVGIMNVNPV